MTAKRYFKREFEVEYYIFDSQTISEKEFDEKFEYEDYLAFEDSMQGDEVVNRLNELHDENQRLKGKVSSWKITASEEISEKQELMKQIVELKEENGQLKQRNNRQAKQLDRLYHLIEEKDWRTLNDILDDFKRCEEQLQREWRTYK